ncbi:Hemicentin-2, partial [Acropora cervicornis]
MNALSEIMCVARQTDNVQTRQGPFLARVERDILQRCKEIVKTSMSVPYMVREKFVLGSYICQCMEPGFVGDGKQCVDIDECAIGNYTCGDNAVCVNALGSYACFCADDINECESDTKRCSSNAECVNSEGSYQCICRQGYEVRGAECRDIDECASGEADCKQDSQCINVPGSYACQCKLGYHLTGDLCQDVNECQQNLAECHHRADCYNTDGSYLCVCKSGFYGDGYYCTS